MPSDPRVPRRIGSYELHALIGAGGMGEVYQARDTKLGRDVAIKVLPDAFTTDTDRLARFEREARLLAALNHPNIAAIYGFEDAGGVRALVLELVGGETLADRVRRGALPMTEALNIAEQVVDALIAAHEKGIVHRDLKPANIKITAAGTVKVLDFGLAKAAEEHAPDFSHSPTITVGGTRNGVMLGTAAYMSPEQARGLAVDRRTDIWAFGCVLYEMLTGRAAFARATLSDTIAAVLEHDPDWRALPPATPPSIRRLLQRCLEKDLKRRLHDVGDAALEIEEARTGQPQASAWPGRRSLAWTAALVGAAAIAGIAYAFTQWGRNRTPGREAPLHLASSQITAQPGAEWFPSLSPDGKWVVYGGESSGNRDIYLQSVTGQNAVNLTGDSPADDDQPAFSPDGDRIAFRSSRDGGGIFVMGRTGEAVRRLTRGGFRPSWSPDGRELAYTTEEVDVNPQNGRGPSELWIVDVNSGQERQIDVAAVQASWSPNRLRLAISVRGSGSQQMEIVTIPVSGGASVPAITDPSLDWNPVWSPDGKWLYYTSNRSGTMSLWRVAIDERSGQVSVPPEPIAAPSPFAAHPSISADGRRIAYSSVLITTNIAKLAVDPASGTITGQPVDVTTGSRPWSSPDPSPGGDWIVFYSQQNPVGDLYVVRADGAGLRQLTSDPALDRVPRWSPDGEWIAFFSTRGGDLRLWKIRPDGSDLLQITDANTNYPVWSPDGKRIAASGGRIGDGSGVPKTYIFDSHRPWQAQTPEVLPPFDRLPKRFVATSWSPDGERLAGQTSLASGVVVYSLGSRTYDRIADYGEFPQWLPDSRRLIFVADGKNFFIADAVTKQIRKVFTSNRDVVGPPRLARDGRTAYFSRRMTESDIWLLTLNDNK